MLVNIQTEHWGQRFMGKNSQPQSWGGSRETTRDGSRFSRQFEPGNRSRPEAILVSCPADTTTSCSHSPALPYRWLPSALKVRSCGPSLFPVTLMSDTQGVLCALSHSILWCDALNPLSCYLEQTSGSCGMEVLSACISEWTCGFSVLTCSKCS